MDFSNRVILSEYFMVNSANKMNSVSRFTFDCFVIAYMVGCRLTNQNEINVEVFDCTYQFKLALAPFNTSRADYAAFETFQRFWYFHASWVEDYLINSIWHYHERLFTGGCEVSMHTRHFAARIGQEHVSQTSHATAQSPVTKRSDKQAAAPNLTIGNDACHHFKPLDLPWRHVSANKSGQSWTCLSFVLSVKAINSRKSNWLALTFGVDRLDINFLRTH